MIVYSPATNEAITSPRGYKPRHCFLMTQLGRPIPKIAIEIRMAISAQLNERGYKPIDANTAVTGRDLLEKIWDFLAATPIAIAICHEEMSEKTLMNVIYELGVAQAMGNETLLVKTPRFTVPSDLMRTEHVNYDDEFDQQFNKYMNNLQERADHYEETGDLLENNPVLSLDYYRRAYLITGSGYLKQKIKDLIEEAGLGERAKNSVEQLVAVF